jgi:hypothetical protein
MAGALVKDPDRLEPAHMRHQDVDHHQIDLFVLESAEAGFSSVGNRHPEMIPLQIDLDGHAHHRVVFDENMVQVCRPRLSFPFRRFKHQTAGHAALPWLVSKH